MTERDIDFYQQGSGTRTATYPDVDMKQAPPKLPEHIEAYYQIKRRALIMQIRAVNKLLGIDNENDRL